MIQQNEVHRFVVDKLKLLAFNYDNLHTTIQSREVAILFVIGLMAKTQNMCWASDDGQIDDLPN